MSTVLQSASDTVPTGAVDLGKGSVHRMQPMLLAH